jgi:chloride channel 7
MGVACDPNDDDPVCSDPFNAITTNNGRSACPSQCEFTPSVQKDCVKLGTADMSCHIVHPGMYAFIGATCMLGGMTRMTISLCVILMETTNNIQYLLPIMLTLSLSKWVGDIFNISLYDMHVEIKCIPFLEFKPPVGMEQLHAEDLMSTPVVTFNEIESAETIVQKLKQVGHNGFPVLRNGTKKFVGSVLRSQLIVLLKLRAFCGPEGLKNPSRLTQAGPQGNDDQADCSWFGGVQVTSDDFATKLQSEVDDIAEIGISDSMLAGKFIDMRPIMNPRPFSVGEETSLVRVFRLCRAMGIRHLPVVNIVRHNSQVHRARLVLRVYTYMRLQLASQAWKWAALAH